MKKLIILLMLSTLFSGCGKSNIEEETTEPTTQATAETTVAAEPVKVVDSPEEFLNLGIFIDVPTESEDVCYSVLNGNVAEINFQYAETQYILRASKVETVLDFDIDEEYKQLQDSMENENTQVTIRTTVGDSKVATWTSEDTNFILYSLQPVEREAFNHICMWLAFPE